MEFDKVMSEPVTLHRDWLPVLERYWRFPTRSEMPRRLIRKRYRYSSREKLEDAFNTALDVVQTKPSNAAFSAVFRTSINADQKQLVTSFRYGFRQCWRECPCKRWWFMDKQWSNYSTLCPARPVLHTSVQYLIAFCNWLKGASDVISGRFVRQIVLEVCKISWFCLNLSREIPPEAVGSSIFNSFFLLWLPTGSRYWRHIWCGCRLCWYRCPCKIWQF